MGNPTNVAHEYQLTSQREAFVYNFFCGFERTEKIDLCDVARLMLAFIQNPCYKQGTGHVFLTRGLQ